MMLSLVITVLPAHAVDETDLERLAKNVRSEEQLMEQEQVIQGLTENQTLIVFRKAALISRSRLTGRRSRSLKSRSPFIRNSLTVRKRIAMTAIGRTTALRERIAPWRENDSYSYRCF